MLKKSMKIIAALVVLAIVAVVLSQVAFAAPASTPMGAVSGSPDDFIDYNPTPSDSTGASASVGRMANAVLSVAQVVGVAVAVIMLIVLAIKYISAAPSDKAEIKKHAVVYVVGAVVLFAASGIMQIIKNFAANVKS